MFKLNKSKSHSEIRGRYYMSIMISTSVIAAASCVVKWSITTLMITLNNVLLWFMKIL